jgi:ferredoxin
MISDDALAMDKVMGRIAGLDEDLNPFLEAVKDNKDNKYTWDNIEIAGEKLEDTIIDDFSLPQTAGQKRLVENNFASKYIMPFVRNALNPYPYADPVKCDGCMTCQEVCPKKIIRYDGKKVIVDNGQCIRCFCCGEMCPQGAIEPKYSLIADMILNRLGFGGKKS